MFNKTVRSALVLALFAAAGCATVAEPPVASIPAEARYVHTPDLAPIIKRFVTAQGFMDPAFPPTVAKPSAYYSDFYGLQAISDVSRAQILADLVPSYATKVAEDEGSVTLRFPKGYTAQFYPQSALSVMGTSTPMSHVAISGDDWRALRSNLDDLLATLEKAKLTKRYLVPNPFLADEKLTQSQLQSGKFAPITVDPALIAFAGSRDGVLLLPEAVHGRPEDVTKAIEVVRSQRADWIGLEMLDVTKQAELDAFNSAAKGTPAYSEARAKLVAYFADAWNGRAGPKTSGEDNPYFKLVEAAHDRGTRVVAIESGSLPFLLFRFGETPFGAGVRSSWWAKSVPPTGKGIIFGGKSHFNDPEAINVQDFLAVLQPGRTFFSLEPLERKKPA